MATLVDSFYCYNTCSLSKKVNFYTCPRLTFLKKNATENAYKSISEPLDFKLFWGGGGGGMPPDTPSGSSLRRSKVASSCSEVWLQSRYCSSIPRLYSVHQRVATFQIRGTQRSLRSKRFRGGFLKSRFPFRARPKQRKSAF